jgi:hypothetical protein
MSKGLNDGGDPPQKGFAMREVKGVRLTLPAKVQEAAAGVPCVLSRAFYGSQAPLEE